MKAEDVCSGTRAILADALYVLTTGPAFSFVIDCKGYYNQQISLCSRLGLTVPDYEALLVGARLATINKHGLFEILPSQWASYLKSGYLIFLGN